MMERKTHLIAGRKALKAVSGLLGLDSAGSGWKLEALCCLGRDNIRLGLAQGRQIPGGRTSSAPGGGLAMGGLAKAASRIVFYLVPLDSAEAIVFARKLGLSLDSAASPALKRFLETMAARLKDRSLADILAVLHDDPETFAELEPSGPAESRLMVPMAAGPINLLEAGWRNFFGDQDFEVLLGYPELSMKKTIYARYSDRECLYSWAGNDPRKWSFFAYPMRVPSDSFGAAVFRKGVIMELDEKDMVLGPREKADALVDSVAARARSSDAEFVVFNHFCTTIVMGEDFAEVGRRMEDASGRTTIRWSHRDRDLLDNFGDYFRSLMGKLGFFDAPCDPDSVNLFHFPTDYREAQLVPFLKELGLKINLRLFPDVEFPAVASLPKARLQIFCEATSYQAKLHEILAKSPRPVLTVKAPYGIEGTQECLSSIAKAAGKEKAFEAAWGRKIAEVGPLWDAMRLQAKGLRLAFVTADTTLPRLWGLRHGQGPPLMKMIQEMGFGVDIIYHDPHAEGVDIPEGRDITLTVFRTPAELDDALRTGLFQAVYSDIFFDWRLTCAGKARFASKDFEMGLDGAVRSFQRLLGACRMPFYARYGSHLAGLEGRNDD
ncbi:MAG: hypothetical protein HZB91_11210 [Elusimicrobia bacterium]|nr:hypothetical protein [Elusimicrobiota bacterium]